ncbi:ABC transporter substrate-binding protein [Paraglaciecola sp. 2405UD69-4]|uniref:ABC transporter substrate-binding protein n=1 Tax=Paraglaciecola sp. 2405UD69-4 TaxID=3391836 RepID=UPI0039C987F0
MKHIKILISVLIMLVSQQVYATTITMVIPDKQGWVFWELVNQVSEAVAKSLDVELKIVTGGEDRFATLAIIEKITSSKTKPDYLIFRPFNGNAITIFDKIEASGIKFVTLESVVYGDEALTIQRPKQKYKHWIGEVAFDNVKGGKLLLDTLIKEHHANTPERPASIIGLGGDFASLSTSRHLVLTELEQLNDKRLNQIFPTYWDPTYITDNFALMMNRYPDANVFWCASDELALEVLKQSQLLFKKPKVIGGFDWLPEVLETIKTGQLTASMGGHFLMGAIAITNIVDYEHGIDRFASHTSPYEFELITKLNVQPHLDFMKQQKWLDVDFKQFSAYRAGKTPPPLTIQNILKTL